MIRKACIVLVGATLAWSVAFCDVRMYEGGAPFGLSLSFKSSPGGQDGSLMLRFSGKYPKGSPAHAVLRLPPELELVEGHLTRAFDAWAGDSWTVAVRRLGTGTTSVVASVRINSRDLVDEGEYRLSVPLAGPTSGIEPATPIRLERVRSGQRFRFGGAFLVPIDSAEYVIQQDIDPVNGKPQVVEQTDAIDSLATVPSRRKVVVFVDAAGRVRDARPLGPSRVAPHVTTLVRETLGKWLFKPAMAKGRAVADWVIVEVRIVPAAGSER